MANGKISTDRALLWTNPNPTASFEAQTISLDLASYSAVQIDADYTSTSYGVSVIVVKNSVPVQMNAITSLAATGAISIANRTAKMTDTGVEFSNGYLKGVSSTAAPTVQNDRIIPQHIYGIK